MLRGREGMSVLFSVHVMRKVWPGVRVEVEVGRDEEGIWKEWVKDASARREIGRMERECCILDLDLDLMVGE
jgi:hypothetical protein